VCPCRRSCSVLRSGSFRREPARFRFALPVSRVKALWPDFVLPSPPPPPPPKTCVSSFFPCSAFPLGSRLSVSGFHFRAPRPGLVAKHCSTGMFLPDLSVRRRRSIFLLLKARIQLPLTVFLSGFFLTAQRAGPRAKISVCS
jgi:hypothetical protein